LGQKPHQCTHRHRLARARLADDANTSPGANSKGIPLTACTVASRLTKFTVRFSTSTSGCTGAGFHVAGAAVVLCRAIGASSRHVLTTAATLRAASFGCAAGAGRRVVHVAGGEMRGAVDPRAQRWHLRRADVLCKGAARAETTAGWQRDRLG